MPTGDHSLRMLPGRGGMIGAIQMIRSWPCRSKGAIRGNIKQRETFWEDCAVCVKEINVHVGERGK